MLAATTFLVSLTTLRILLTYLPARTAGLWMLYLSIAGYFVIFDLGVSPTLGREISFILGDTQLTEIEKEQKASRLVHSCMMLFMGLAVVLMLAACLFGFPYLHAVSTPELWHSVMISWAIFILGGAANLVGEVWLAGLYGLGEIAAERVSRGVGQILWLVLSYVALRLHTGLIGLAAAWLIQGVVVRLYARIRFRASFKTPGLRGSFDATLVRGLIVPSAKYSLMLLGGIIAVQTDNLVIAYVFGTSAIPPYQAIAKLITAMMSLSMMLVITTSPFLSRAHAENDHRQVGSLLSRNLRVSLTVMVVLSAFLVTFADRVIRIWLGPDHFIGFPVVIGLTVVMILETHHMSWATAVMATGRLPFVTSSLVAAALNIVCSLVFAHRIGILGVAFGTLAAQLTTNNWYIPFYGMRQFHIPFAQHCREILLPVAKVLVLSASAAMLVRVVTASLPAVISIACGAVLVTVVGIAGASYWVLDRAEQETLFQSIRQKFALRGSQ
jgi:O-antigen/teichoic acid export membrane protein